jgi:hypothetical protein
VDGQIIATLRELKSEFPNFKLKDIVFSVCEYLSSIKNNKSLLENLDNYYRAYKKNVTLAIKYKLLNQSSQNNKYVTYSKFFFHEFKCPEEIENCEELRKTYFNQLELLKSEKNCRKCDEMHLQKNFIANILAHAIKPNKKVI